MDVQTQVSLESPQQLVGWLRSVRPGYTYEVRGRFVIVGSGVATGVLLRAKGPGRVTLVWAFPSMATQLILTLSIVFTGILPGLLAMGIVWLAVSSDVDRMKQDLSMALTGAASSASFAGGYGATPVSTSGSGTGLMVGGIFMVLASLGSLGFAANEFSDADRCDRWASERQSETSYGSGGYYRSSGLSASFWTMRAQTHRQQGSAAIGGGLFLMALAVAMFVARSSKRAKSSMGYNAAAPNAQYAYPQQYGANPQPGGYPPQQGGYAPQQGGYAPQQGGYAPQQGGYAPQQGGYAPQQGGYAPQQGGYAPQQGGYAPQQGGYSPQQGYSQQDYAQQPQAYPQPQGYSPQGPGTPSIPPPAQGGPLPAAAGPAPSAQYQSPPPAGGGWPGPQNGSGNGPGWPQG